MKKHELNATIPVEAGPSRGTSIAICAGLALITVLVYGQVVGVGQVPGFDFVNFDDPAYVYNNVHVLKGLSVANVGWAFTTTAEANWHPLTWLSLMLDAQIAGSSAALYHLHNLALHILSTLLLFLLLSRMTGHAWRSAFVAALFAIHPLHVESVAWIAERKDVLSTVFWMLTMWAYVAYVRRPRAFTYAAMILVYALGLMAKPMLVSLPIVLLILDYWPLGRLQVAGYRLREPEAERQRTGTQHPTPNTRHPVWEKLPLFALSAGSCVVTYLAQAHGATVARMSEEPIGMRLGNAVVSYAMYAWKMLWPSRLAVFYPIPRYGQPLWMVAIAAAFLIAVSVLVWRARRRFPFVLVGWLWYLVTLLPVVGLVQVGMQARADRYTYVPLIGLFILVAWLTPQVLGAPGKAKGSPKAKALRGKNAPRWLAAAGVAIVFALAACAWRQVGCWRNSMTLAEHAVAVVKDNYMAQLNLGVALAEEGRYHEAIDHYNTALAISPPSDSIHANLGNAYFAIGETGTALEHFVEAVRLKPGIAEHHVDLGSALIRVGRAEDGIAECEEAQRLDADNVHAQNEIAYGLITLGRLDEALPYCERVLDANPRDPDAHVNLGLIELQRGDPAAAEEHFRTAVEIDPEHADAHNDLGAALAHQDRFDEAIGEFRRAIELEPNRADFRRNLERVRSVMPASQRGR